MSDPTKHSSVSKVPASPSAVEKYRQLQRGVAASRGSLTWNDCPEEELRDMVANVTEDGAAILLAKTSDGGALVVRCIVDKESVPFYAPDMAALNLLLREVVEMFR